MLATGVQEFFALNPLLFERLKIGAISGEIGVNKAVWVGLVIEYHIKGNEVVGLPCSGET